MKLLSFPTVAAATLLAGSLQAQAARYIEIPNGWGGTDITPDGSLIVGSGPTGAFYWRWDEEPAPTFIGGVSAAAVSDDGTVIAGDMIDPGTGAQVAAIWTEDDGWQSLGWLPNALQCPSLSNAFDISADGTTVVGLSWSGCNGRGFLWTEATGMQELEVLANGGNRATAIAKDGSLIVGFAAGSAGRTPASWTPDLSGEIIDINLQGEVLAVSADGSVRFGAAGLGMAPSFSAYFESDADGLTNLGSLNGPDWAGWAKGADATLRRVIGFDSQSLSREAWTWTPHDGVRSLNSTLSQYGVTGAPTLQVPQAISDDGTVITGNNVLAGWIVTLPPPCSWAQYGLEASPANTLQLDGGGDSDVGGTFLATTTGAAGPATATIISLGQASFPFLGGTALFDPLKLINPILVEATAGGSSTNTIPIPNDAALAGASVYFQSLTEDGGQPGGFALSNGLWLTICS